MAPKLPQNCRQKSNRCFDQSYPLIAAYFFIQHSYIHLVGTPPPLSSPSAPTASLPLHMLFVFYAFSFYNIFYLLLMLVISVSYYKYVYICYYLLTLLIPSQCFISICIFSINFNFEVSAQLNSKLFTFLHTFTHGSADVRSYSSFPHLT